MDNNDTQPLPTTAEAIAIVEREAARWDEKIAEAIVIRDHLLSVVEVLKEKVEL